MKTGKDLPALIKGFYTLETEGGTTGQYEGVDFIALLQRLHRERFPEYTFDIHGLLAQAKAQLCETKEAVQFRRPVRFTFASPSGGSPLVIAVGIVPGGQTLGLWAEDPAINERIQSALAEGDRETDTNS
jgi:hypothetical protein